MNLWKVDLPVVLYPLLLHRYIHMFASKINQEIHRDRIFPEMLTGGEGVKIFARWKRFHKSHYHQDILN